MMSKTPDDKSGKTFYRAGTREQASLDVTHQVDEVWLVTNPQLYYPLSQNLPVGESKDSQEVCLYKTTFVMTDATAHPIRIRDHPDFQGVCIVELTNLEEEKRKKSKKGKKGEIKSHLRELCVWEPAVMEKCRGGSSLVNCSELVQAVIEYMKDNYPNNPEEFNFQAELKAACHWYWTKDGEALKEGPHVNCRIKTAAMKILTKWEKELKELTRSQKQAESQRITGKVLFSVKSPMVLIVESFVGCSSIPVRV